MALNRDIQSILREVDRLNAAVDRTNELFSSVTPPSGEEEVRAFTDAFAQLEEEIQDVASEARRIQDPIESFVEAAPALRAAAQSSEAVADAFAQVSQNVRASLGQTNQFLNAFRSGLGNDSFVVQAGQAVVDLRNELRDIARVAEATGDDIGQALGRSLTQRIGGRVAGGLVRLLNTIGQRGAQALLAPFNIIGRNILQGLNEVFVGFFEQIGRSAVEGIGRQLTSVVQNSIGDFNEYGAAIASVNTILQDYEVQQVRLNEVISESLTLSANQFADVQVAEAFYSALSSGAQDLAEAQSLVNSALALSVAGGGEDSSIGASLQDTQALVAGIINSFRTAADDIRLSFEDANRVASILFTTTELGQVTLAGLASQFGEITSIAAAAGIELEDLAASVATVTQAGVNTNIAVTGIQNIIQRVLDPTQEALELANQLGLALGPQLLDSAQGGGLTVLAERLSALQEQGRLTTGTISSLFGIEAGRSLFPLINQVERQASNLQELREAGSGGAVSEAAVTQLRSTAASFTGVVNAFDSLVTSIGAIPTNFLQPIAAVFQELFNNIRQSFEENLEGISAVAFAAGDVIAGVFENVLGEANSLGESIARQVSSLVGVDFDNVIEFQQRNVDANNAVTAIQEGNDPGGIFSGQSIDEISQALQEQNRLAEAAFRQEIGAGFAGLVAQVGTRIEEVINSVSGIAEILISTARFVIDSVLEIIGLLSRFVTAILSRFGGEGERDAARFTQASENLGLNTDVGQAIVEAFREGAPGRNRDEFGELRSDLQDILNSPQTLLTEDGFDQLTDQIIGSGIFESGEVTRDEIRDFLVALDSGSIELQNAFRDFASTNDRQFGIANAAIDSAQSNLENAASLITSVEQIRDIDSTALADALAALGSVSIGDNVEELENPFEGIAQQLEGPARDAFLGIFDGVEGEIDSEEFVQIIQNTRDAIAPFADTSIALQQSLRLLDESVAGFSESLTTTQERIRSELGFEGISQEVSRSLQQQGPVIASFLGNSFRENAPVALEQLRLQIVQNLADQAGAITSEASRAIREELEGQSLAEILSDNEVLLQIPDSTLNDVVRSIFAGIEETFDNLSSAISEYNGALQEQISATENFVNTVSQAGQGILDTQQTGADLIFSSAISQFDFDPNNILGQSVVNQDPAQIRDLVNTLQNEFSTIAERVDANQQLQELGLRGEDLQELIGLVEADNERQLNSLESINAQLENSRAVAQAQNDIALAGANETVAALQQELSSVQAILESGNQLDIVETQQRQAQLDALQTEFEAASRLQRDLVQNQEAGGLDPRALVTSLESQAGFLRQQQQLLRNLGRGDDARALDAQIAQIGEQLINLAPDAAQRDIQEATDQLDIANDQLVAQQNILSLLEGVFPDVAAALDNLVTNNRNATLDRFDNENPLGDIDAEDIAGNITQDLANSFQALEVVARNTDGLLSVTEAVADGQLTDDEVTQLARLFEAQDALGGQSAIQLAGIAQNDINELFRAITSNLAEGDTDFVQNLLDRLLSDGAVTEVVAQQEVEPPEIAEIDPNPIIGAISESILNGATFSEAEGLELTAQDIVEPIQVTPTDLGFEDVNRRALGLPNAPIDIAQISQEQVAASQELIAQNATQLAAIERQTSVIEQAPSFNEGGVSFNQDRADNIGTPVDFTAQLEPATQSLINSFSGIDDELSAFQTSISNFAGRVDRVGERLSENEFDISLGGTPQVDEQLINSALNLGPAGLNFDQIFSSNLFAPQDIEPLIAGIVDNALGESNAQIASALSSSINDAFGNLEGIVDTSSEIAGIQGVINNLSASIDTLSSDLDLTSNDGQTELLRRAQELASVIDNVGAVLTQSQAQGAEGLGQPLNELQDLLGRLSSELPDDIQTAISDATVMAEQPAGEAQETAQAIAQAVGSIFPAATNQAASEADTTPLQAAEESITSFSATSTTTLQAFASQAQDDINSLTNVGENAFETIVVSFDSTAQNIEDIANTLVTQGQNNFDATNQPQQGAIDASRGIDRQQQDPALTRELQQLNDFLAAGNADTAGGATIENVTVNVEVGNATNETVAEDIGDAIQRSLQSVLTNVLETI